MPEAIAAKAPQARMPMLVALGAGVLLTVLAGFGGAVAAVALALAQPGFALAAAQWRGRGGSPRALLREAVWLAALWASGFAIAFALVAWPLQSLLRDGSLAAALGLSLVAGLLLIAAWRVWPL